MLPVALEAPGEFLSNDFYTFGGPVETRSDGEVAVVVRYQHVTAYDPRTHEERWRLRVPEAVCDSSGVVGGRVALLTGLRGMRGCRQVTLVDAGDGTVLWRRDTREDQYVENPGVALSRTEVYAAGACSEVRRFTVDGGDTLAPLGDVDACGDSAALDDDAVATVRERDGDATGFELSVLDPATGDTVTDRAEGVDDRRVNAVITTDPLVMEVQEDGYRGLQRYDDRGRPLGFLGRAFDPYGSDTDVLVAARVDDVLVLSYKDLPGYRAHDLTTGEEVWTTDDSRSLAGTDGQELVWTQPVEVLGEDGSATSQQQVTRTPVEDPADGELLGALGGRTDVTATSEGDLLVDDGSGVDVVPLPAGGLADAPAPGTSTLDTSAVADPPPAKCTWDVYALAQPGETSLTVTARAVSPGELPESEDAAYPDPGVEEAARTATGAATQVFSGAAGRWQDLDSLGDEALASSRTYDTGSRSTARVRVRSGNVLVEVDASVSGPVGPRGRPIPVAVLEDAVRQAAADVLDTTLG